MKNAGDSLRTIGQFPLRVVEHDNVFITVRDGCRLAARMWLPEDTERKPVPAVLEYIPYRKRDGTAERDARSHPYVAGHGYACIRVDMRGNGESDGLMQDEYLRLEQDDALDVIEWISAQPWCTGKVGMWGISWGGFNAMQVAARRPAALKAIITLCSTDDRYADDIHYKGGALLMENLGWAATMLSYSSRPPDPELVGEQWRESWLSRLEHNPFLVETWLSHPHRDDYWKHGSVCEDWGAIEAAVFAVGGWADAYHNAVPRMLANLRAPCLGLIGPWVHKYPHLAVPEPAIGFLQEALRWWDHWLKGIDTGIMNEPRYRSYLMDSVEPLAQHLRRPGTWVSEPAWPSPRIDWLTFALNSYGLDHEPEPTQSAELRSPTDTGTAGGEYCPIWLGPEGPVDQRIDDAYSLTFDSAPLDGPIDILGAPRVHLALASDQPVAQVVVRLNDVRPDGAVSRISYGVLNLCHRDSHETPKPLVPGQTYETTIQLDDTGYRLPAGHRLRVAVSSAYWPLLWPAPTPVTLSVKTGLSSIEIPRRNTRTDEPIVRFGPPQAASELEADVVRRKTSRRIVERDLETNVTTVRVDDDFGESKQRATGLTTGSTCVEVYRIQSKDPTSCTAEIEWTQLVSRDDWEVRTTSNIKMTCDREHFYLIGSLDGFESEERVFSKNWHRTVKRQLV